MTRTEPAPAAADARPQPAGPMHSPVPRADGARWVALLAVSFGVTVVVTRLYLSLSGWPQIGGDVYHLAHALWGGLLLIVGGVLTLLWGNRWVQPLTAVLVGAGSGLFVDEVGKFITQRNDYFTPLAAPIIYLVFLGVLAVAVLARRAHLTNGRTLAYSVTVALKAVADGPLRPAARRELLRDIDALAADTSRPDLADLATRVRPVVENAPVVAAPQRMHRVLGVLTRIERAVLPRWLHRVVLILGSVLIGLLSLVGLAVFVALATGDPDATIIIDDETVPPGSRPPALVIASAGETVVGLMLVVAAGALLIGRDRFGLRVGRLGLVLGLAGVNVVLGYIDADLVVAVVVLELALLGLYHRYRLRFLENRSITDDPPG
ncbi:hypothetical protein Psed_0496 [Pseudonocardia dioxanivorans CB1190]|uniref:Uncharacterized protein n=1 Tax=Pseudonocardia dioxanivorans (strain ATCC 55486 / DSM 44775 / JCM 13855 / CB1190) TaxID=675635 RepID=F4CM77_PSEUX|nr:hypothetical protein [Pseudonocardia dioxanivorans]AEA22760.1 hypothetical protein Psed_0496 [Pseudonocardia dioxanivorans CB1190]